MSEKIRKAIKMIAGTHVPNTKTFTATVLQVEDSEYTCTVQAGQDRYIARLKAVLDMEDTEGFVLIPAQNSEVIITEINVGEFAVTGYSTINKILLKTGESTLKMDKNGVVFNEGSFGGLIKIQELKSELDKINQIVQAIMTVLSGAPVAEPGNGNPSALQQVLSSAIAGKLLPTYSTIENEKIKH